MSHSGSGNLALTQAKKIIDRRFLGSRVCLLLGQDSRATFEVTLCDEIPYCHTKDGALDKNELTEKCPLDDGSFDLKPKSSLESLDMLLSAVLPRLICNLLLVFDASTNKAWRCSVSFPNTSLSLLTLPITPRCSQHRHCKAHLMSEVRASMMSFVEQSAPPIGNFLYFMAIVLKL